MLPAARFAYALRLTGTEGVAGRFGDMLLSVPLFEMTAESFRPISAGSFARWQVRERGDIQRLLVSQIDVLGEDLLVLDEEFGDWEESRRRIDILALDRAANLVVVELKRTADGGHMELQAIRYASMVSTMPLERAAQVHAAFLARRGIASDVADATDRILAFLGWEEVDEDAFAPDVRILLVSEDFGKELTTAVLWLRERDIDIRCVRLRPYDDQGRRLVDVQQIIPLPEANEYQVQVREKEQRERRHRAERYDVRLKFWTSLVEKASSVGLRHGALKPGSYHWLGVKAGAAFGFNFVIVREVATVELYIDHGDAAANKASFDALYAKKEKVELRFGEALIWERLEAKRACRIKYMIDIGGYASPESLWPEIQQRMVDAMQRLELAIRPELQAIAS